MREVDRGTKVRVVGLPRVFPCSVKSAYAVTVKNDVVTTRVRAVRFLCCRKVRLFRNLLKLVKRPIGNTPVYVNVDIPKMAHNNITFRNCVLGLSPQCRWGIKDEFSPVAGMKQ